MIKGHCTTTLDDHKMMVNEFYQVPNKGDKVACLWGSIKVALWVKEITHDIKNGKPYIIVELSNNSYN